MRPPSTLTRSAAQLATRNRPYPTNSMSGVYPERNTTRTAREQRGIPNNQTRHKFMYLPPLLTFQRNNTVMTLKNNTVIVSTRASSTHTHAAALFDSFRRGHSLYSLTLSLRLVWGVFSLTLTFPPPSPSSSLSLSPLGFPPFETNSRLAVARRAAAASLPWAPAHCRRAFHSVSLCRRLLPILNCFLD